MIGTVTSYSGTTLTVNITAAIGAGTYTSWLINLGAVGAQGPVGPQGPAGTTGTNAGPLGGQTQGLKIVNDTGTPNTKIDVSAIAATMVNTAGVSVRATGISLVVDLTTGTSVSTANGMDGEARGSSNWVYLYLISNGSTTAGLASLVSPLTGNPTLPAGYTYFTYIGAMYVDGSSNLKRTQQNGRIAHYVITSATNTAAMPTMASGIAGSVSSPTWVGITLSGFVPNTASHVDVSANCDVGGTPATVIAAPNNAYGNGTSTNPPPIIATTEDSCIGRMPVESANGYWASSGADGYLFCLGWEDYCATA